MNKEKKFLIPELYIVVFHDEDIIRTSGEGDIDEGNDDTSIKPFPFE